MLYNNDGKTRVYVQSWANDSSKHASKRTFPMAVDPFLCLGTNFFREGRTELVRVENESSLTSERNVN